MNALENSFDISNVDPGTILQIETRNSIYKIEFIKGKVVQITGGMKSNGEDRFSVPKEAVIVGSTSPPDASDCYIGMNKIIAGQKLLVQCVEGENMFMLRTSPVKNVKIESSDGELIYDMDWNI
jgi:hypothetical protein